MPDDHVWVAPVMPLARMRRAGTLISRMRHRRTHGAAQLLGLAAGEVNFHRQRSSCPKERHAERAREDQLELGWAYVTSSASGGGSGAGAIWPTIGPRR
jgi:hypothetical protein